MPLYWNLQPHHSQASILNTLMNYNAKDNKLKQNAEYEYIAITKTGRPWNQVRTSLTSITLVISQTHIEPVYQPIPDRQ